MASKIRQIILNSLRINKDKIVFDDGEKFYTYSELDYYSEIICKYLYEVNNPSNSVVSIGTNDFFSLCVLVACIKSLHIYCPIDENNTENRIQNIVNVINPKIIFAHRVTDLKLEDYVVINYDDVFNKIILAQPYSNLFTDRQENYVYTIFTSGTTGTPKGVLISYENLNCFSEWFLSKEFGLEENDRILLQSTFAFDLSVMSWLPVLSMGKTLVVLSPKIAANYKKIQKWLQKVKFDLFISTPFFLKLIDLCTNFSLDNFSYLNKIILCGEELQKAMAKRILDTLPNVKLYNTYGPTECTVAVSGIEVTYDLLSYDSIPIGTIREGVEFVVDISNEELSIAGNMVSDGYINNFMATSSNFKKHNNYNLYKTGDKIYIDKKGYIFFKGRIDDQIKWNGYRIELREVESTIRKIDIVSDAAVIVTRNRDEEVNGMIAYLTLKNHTIEFNDYEVVYNMIKKLLPKYMLPKRIEIIDEMPLNNNKKIDRRALLAEKEFNN